MALMQEEKKRAGSHLLHEYDKQMSREGVTVTGGSYAVAQVMGEVTASGKYKDFDPAAADGSEVPAGILFDAVDASTADADGVVTDTLAIVRKEDLVWKAGTTDAQKDAALATLRKNNLIKAR